jgi:acyl dehydratase
MGVAAHAILKTCCGYDASRLTSMEVRFSAPVYPGDVLRIEIWRDGAVVSFRASVAAREELVLNSGRAQVA